MISNYEHVPKLHECSFLATEIEPYTRHTLDKTSFQSSVKKKTNQLVFIYLVTQNHLYSKNLQQTPTILCFYCKDLYPRIPEHQDFLFYEFPTNFYWISKFTARNYKEVLRALFNWVTVYSNNPLGFLEFQTWSPWPQGRTGEREAREVKWARANLLMGSKWKIGGWMVLVDVEQGAAAEGARRRGGSSRGLATRGGGLASLNLVKLSEGL